MPAPLHQRGAGTVGDDEARRAMLQSSAVVSYFNTFRLQCSLYNCSNKASPCYGSTHYCLAAMQQGHHHSLPRASPDNFARPHSLPVVHPWQQWILSWGQCQCPQVLPRSNATQRQDVLAFTGTVTVTEATLSKLLLLFETTMLFWLVDTHHFQSQCSGSSSKWILLVYREPNVQQCTNKTF